MCWPRITINAAVLAASIGIKACFKADIWTVVTSDNRFGSVAKILRCAARSLFCSKGDIDNIAIILIYMQFLEAICGTPRCATSANGLAALCSLLNNRPVVLCHGISSHEHIAVSSKSCDYFNTPSHNHSMRVRLRDFTWSSGVME